MNPDSPNGAYLRIGTYSSVGGLFVRNHLGGGVLYKGGGVIKGGGLVESLQCI